MVALLWLILIVVLAVWFFGLLLDVAGGLIHLLLIVALALLIVNLFQGMWARRS